MKRRSNYKCLQPKALKKDIFVFDIKKLPPEILMMILEYLNLEDKKKMRHLDSWFEKKVTDLLPNIFCSYNIRTQIRKENCKEIISFLTCAMSKYHRKKKELYIRFSGKHTQIMKDLLVNYAENIVSLGISLWNNEDLGYLTGLKFDFLENLSVSHIENEMWPTYYAIIAQHAHKLKILQIGHFAEGDSLPVLPVLDYLELNIWKEIKNWGFLVACNQSITKLKISTNYIDDVDDDDDETNFSFNAQPANSNDSFVIPNLEHLIIENNFGFNDFVIQNANNLVSLEMPLDQGLKPLPEFPKIRELSIDIYQEGILEDILSECTNTLEVLALTDYVERDHDGDYFSFSLSKLTDLYLKNTNESNIFMCLNNESLEFLFLDDVYPLQSFKSGEKLEKVETVILKPHKHSTYKETYLESMAEMCPNAEIVVWRKENEDEIQNLVKSRCKKKDFKIEIEFLLTKL